MMYPVCPAKGVALLLISLGVGYLVCVKADGQKGFLKQLGYWIGSIIIILSILVPVRNLYHCITKIGTCKGMPAMHHPMRMPGK